MNKDFLKLKSLRLEEFLQSKLGSQALHTAVNLSLNDRQIFYIFHIFSSIRAFHILMKSACQLASFYQKYLHFFN